MCFLIFKTRSSLQESISIFKNKNFGRPFWTKGQEISCLKRVIFKAFSILSILNFTLNCKNCNQIWKLKSISMLDNAFNHKGEAISNLTLLESILEFQTKSIGSCCLSAKHSKLTTELLEVIHYSTIRQPDLFMMRQSQRFSRKGTESRMKYLIKKICMVSHWIWFIQLFQRYFKR